MRYKLLLAVIAVLLLVPATASLSDGADTASAYYIQGYVADTGRTPMEGVTVSVMDGGSVYQDVTDAAGFFNVGVAGNTNLTISFTIFGYTAITCPNATVQQDSEYFIMNLSKATYLSATRTYLITGSVADMQCVIMVASTGDIGGQVTFELTPVRDATVTIIPAEAKGASYTAVTGSDGRYSITCPTGTYTLTSDGKGFNTSSEITVRVTGTPSTVNVSLTKSDLKKYLGMDAAHILMLIGVIVGILLAVAAWFLSRRMDRPNSVEIFDDSAEEEDDFRDL